MICDPDHRFTAKGIVHGEHKTGVVEIGNNCWIGAGVIILRNTKIGDNCVIGAGCVVKVNVPEKSFVTSPREITINPIREEVNNNRNLYNTNNKQRQEEYCGV